MTDNIDPFAGQKYLNLESYRRNGQAVRTPLWFVEMNDRLYVRTPDDAWKVKRVRRTPRVRIAVCNMRGVPKSEWMDATARIAEGDEADDRCDTDNAPQHPAAHSPSSSRRTLRSRARQYAKRPSQITTVTAATQMRLSGLGIAHPSSPPLRARATRASRTSRVYNQANRPVNPTNDPNRTCSMRDSICSLSLPVAPMIVSGCSDQ